MGIVDDARTESVCVDVHWRKRGIEDDLHSQPREGIYIATNDHYQSQKKLDWEQEKVPKALPCNIWLLLALTRACAGWDIVFQIFGTAQEVEIGLECSPTFPVDFILEGRKATSKLN